MENTSKSEPKKREIFYYRQRLKNRVFARLVEFFAKEAEKTDITKKQIAERLDRDPSQITRWLSSPSNLTLETLSDLLYAMNAEPEPPVIVLFKDRKMPNFAHPLIADVIGGPSPISTKDTVIDLITTYRKEVSTTAGTNVSNVAPHIETRSVRTG